MKPMKCPKDETHGMLTRCEWTAEGTVYRCTARPDVTRLEICGAEVLRR